MREGSFQVETMGSLTFDCFREMMIRHNISSKGSLRPDKDRQFAVVNYNIDGLKMLWNIALGASDKEVKEKATAFLVEIHVSLWREKKADLPRISRTFIQVTMDAVPRENPNRARVLEVLTLARRFVNQYLCCDKVG